MPDGNAAGNNVKTLNEVLASRSSESQLRIKEMADDMIIETGIKIIREEQKTEMYRRNAEVNKQGRDDNSAK